MKLTIIGCTGSMSGPSSAASSYLLQAPGTGGKTWSVLFDLGPGAFGQLCNHLDPRDLDAVVFSHGHADHLADVISLEVHHRWHPEGPFAPLTVVGPDGIVDRVHQIDGWSTPDDFAGIFDFQIAQDRQSFQVGPLTVTPFAGFHTVPSFGYRVQGVGRDGSPKSFAYTGDTDTCDSMTQMADGVDLLLSEAAFSRAETVRGVHLTGERAGQLARDAGVKQAVLTHIQPWADPQAVLADAAAVWSGPIALASAGAQHLL